MKSKKNGVLAFVFSLVPGAGEMYMGFMKMGVSMMSIFFFTICVLGLLQADVVCALTAIIIWFYSFFHANHLVALSDEEFEKIEDDYLFGLDAIAGSKDLVKKHQKLIAGILIFVGIMLLWNTTLDVLWSVLPDSVMYVAHRITDCVPRVVAAILIIIAGVKLIKGRKAQLAELEDKEKTEGEA